MRGKRDGVHSVAAVRGKEGEREQWRDGERSVWRKEHVVNGEGRRGERKKGNEVIGTRKQKEEGRKTGGRSASNYCNT